VVELGGARVYHAGDTAYCADVLPAVRELRPEVAIVPVDGRYGNLNPEEAAHVAAVAGATVAVPCHFWLPAEHTGGPGPRGVRRGPPHGGAWRDAGADPPGGRYPHPTGRGQDGASGRGSGAAGGAHSDVRSKEAGRA
jgi:hypothetical protein